MGRKPNWGRGIGMGMSTLGRLMQASADRDREEEIGAANKAERELWRQEQWDHEALAAKKRDAATANRARMKLDREDPYRDPSMLPGHLQGIAQMMAVPGLEPGIQGPANVNEGKVRLGDIKDYAGMWEPPREFNMDPNSEEAYNNRFDYQQRLQGLGEPAPESPDYGTTPDGIPINEHFDTLDKVRLLEKFGLIPLFNEESGKYRFDSVPIPDDNEGSSKRNLTGPQSRAVMGDIFGGSSFETGNRVDPKTGNWRPYGEDVVSAGSALNQLVAPEVVQEIEYNTQAAIDAGRLPTETAITDFVEAQKEISGYNVLEEEYNDQMAMRSELISMMQDIDVKEPTKHQVDWDWNPLRKGDGERVHEAIEKFIDEHEGDTSWGELKKILDIEGFDPEYFKKYYTTSTPMKINQDSAYAPVKKPTLDEALGAY